jgi:hypothetical protein
VAQGELCSWQFDRAPSDVWTKGSCSIRSWYQKNHHIFARVYLMPCMIQQLLWVRHHFSPPDIFLCRIHAWSCREDDSSRTALTMDFLTCKFSIQERLMLDWIMLTLTEWPARNSLTPHVERLDWVRIISNHEYFLVQLVPHNPTNYDAMTCGGQREPGVENPH